MAPTTQTKRHQNIYLYEKKSREKYISPSIHPNKYKYNRYKNIKK